MALPFATALKSIDFDILFFFYFPGSDAYSFDIEYFYLYCIFNSWWNLFVIVANRNERERTRRN